MTAEITRRGFVAGAGAIGLGAVLAACTDSTTPRLPVRLIEPGDPAVSAAEARRRRAVDTGRTVRHTLDPRPVTVDLGGRPVQTWAYQDSLATPLLRLRAGDRLQVKVRNGLPQATSVHWHGLAIRNNMDGVPGLTQPAIRAGGQFDYDFIVPDPGTYWFHSHVGTQLDRGLYAPLVIEDPDDPGVDVDEVIVLDDWLDGLSGTPDEELATLERGMKGMGGMDHTGAMSMGPSGSGMGGMTSAALGGDAGDVAYPLHLINGRPSNDRQSIRVAPRATVRLRLINAGSDTAYRVAIGGHRLTVTHTDGRAVQPVTVDTVLIGMGERYDVQFVAESGVWPIVAEAEGKHGSASAVLRTRDVNASAAPSSTARPAELDGKLLRYADLTPAAAQRLATRVIDQRFAVDLEGDMSSYRWRLGADASRLHVKSGQRIQITMRNTSAMWHPMHLHGHTFALSDHGGTRKDTVIVLPRQSLRIEFDTDNPGQWLYHCHNLYHQAAGMETTLRYRD